jgi:hypothetical protein
VAATGAIVQQPLAAAAALNASALPAARAGYQLMVQMLGQNQGALIFASLPLSATAISQGLLAYEACLAAGALHHGTTAV